MTFYMRLRLFIVTGTDPSVDIVIELTTAISDRIALPAIRGLARVNGLKVYIGVSFSRSLCSPGGLVLADSACQVSGAKIFSHFAGFDTRSALSDDSDDLITSLEGRKTVIPMLSKVTRKSCFHYGSLIDILTQRLIKRSAVQSNSPGSSTSKLLSSFLQWCSAWSLHLQFEISKSSHPAH